MAVPTSNNKHRILTHNSRMTEPIKWNSAFAFYMLPRVLTLTKFALVQIIEAGSTIITPENVNGSFIKNGTVISSGTRLIIFVLG